MSTNTPPPQFIHPHRLVIKPPVRGRQMFTHSWQPHRHMRTALINAHAPAQRESQAFVHPHISEQPLNITDEKAIGQTMDTFLQRIQREKFPIADDGYGWTMEEGRAPFFDYLFVIPQGYDYFSRYEAPDHGDIFNAKTSCDVWMCIAAAKVCNTAYLYAEMSERITADYGEEAAEPFEELCADGHAYPLLKWGYPEIQQPEKAFDFDKIFPFLPQVTDDAAILQLPLVYRYLTQTTGNVWLDYSHTEMAEMYNYPAWTPAEFDAFAEEWALAQPFIEAEYQFLEWMEGDNAEATLANLRLLFKLFKEAEILATGQLKMTFAEQPTTAIQYQMVSASEFIQGEVT